MGPHREEAHIRILTSIVVSLMVVCFSAETVEAQHASTRPSVPALVADAGAAPFRVDGVTRIAADGGFGFHFATDGQRQACAIFDARDGTPFYYSDEQQALIYDLSANRIVRVPLSRAVVSVDWDAAAPRPLSFGIGVYLCSNEGELAKQKSHFRADRFLAASGASLLVADTGDGTRVFSAERARGIVESVEIPYPSGEWFRFTSRGTDDEGVRLELEAHTEGNLPPEAIAFPDIAALKQDVNVVDYDETLMPGFVMFLKSGRASVEKMALAGDDSMREKLHQSLGSPDWNELRKRDEKLGGAYRAALAKQGIRFIARASSPATKPSK